LHKIHFLAAFNDFGNLGWAVLGADEENCAGAKGWTSWA
jgi:hypothetical protein